MCIDCAHKYVKLATKQINIAQYTLNDRINIIDRLSVAAKERLNVEYTRTVEQADVERDQALNQIDQMIE